MSFILRFALALVLGHAAGALWHQDWHTLLWCLVAAICLDWLALLAPVPARIRQAAKQPSADAGREKNDV